MSKIKERIKTEVAEYVAAYKKDNGCTLTEAYMAACAEFGISYQTTVRYVKWHNSQQDGTCGD